MSSTVRLLALFAAIAGAFGIAAQLRFAIDDKGTLAGGLWELARYYTYWTNTAVLLVMAATAIGIRRFFGRPQVWLAITASIILVGLVYYLLIYGSRAEGYPFVRQLSEHLLHGVVPVVTLVLFLIRPHGGLRWKDIWWGVTPVLVYGVYLLTRGAIDGSWPYWFTDVPKLGFAGSVRSAVLLTGAFAAATLLFIAIDKVLAIFHRRSG